jgi:hypothetical protein
MFLNSSDDRIVKIAVFLVFAAAIFFARRATKADVENGAAVLQ